SPPIWTVPEIGALPNNADGRLVRQGRDLITATYAHIGPEVADPAKRFAGNNLVCGNCHLQAGTKKFGIPLFGLFGKFPHYNARSGAQITIEERPNACMTRSMNGRPLPAGAPEMQALVAYIKFLSTGVAPGQLLPGMGTGNMPELDRAADPARGEALYANACVACHGRHSPQPADHRPRLHDAATLGQRQLQRRRRDGAADHGRKFPPLQHAARRRLPEPAALAGTGLGYCGLRPLPAATAQSRPRQGFSRSSGEAGRCALRPLCRRLQRAAAQIRAVRADPRRDRAPQGGENGRAIPAAALIILLAPPRLDLVPDHRRYVRTAEIFHRADAGRRGDVDLGEVTVDHVDADEEEPALAQRPADALADLALARGELGFLRRAAAHHVRAEIVGRGHAVDRAGELAVDQDDALVAVFDRGQEFLHHPLLAERHGEEVVERAEIEVFLRQPKHRLAALAVERLHH